MKRKKLLSFVVFACLFFPVNIFSVKYGSDSVVSVQPLVTFPNTDTDNEMLEFGLFKNGFKLQDLHTTCTFQSIFPVSGLVGLYGGKLFLNSDLHLANITTITAMGYFSGQGHIMTLDSSVERLINTHYPTTFDNLDLFINSDLTISTTMTIIGNCMINGRGKRLYMEEGSQIIVGHNSSLSLRNLEFEGVRANNIRCMDETGKILLDNISLYMDDNYSFTVGNMEVWNNVDMLGTCTFFYDCMQTFSIAKNSIFKVGNGATFAVGLNKNLAQDRIIYFEDSSAKMWVDNAGVIVGPSGIVLTRGSMMMSGRVNYDVRSTNTGNGIIMGDGTPEGDIIAEFNPASYVTFSNGHVVYDEYDPYKFISQSSYSKIIRGPTNTFHIKRDQAFRNITIKASNTSALSVEPGTCVEYEDCVISMPSVKFLLTGSRFNSYTLLLDGDDEIFLEDGVLLFYLMVKNNNNFISGSGNLSNITTLYNGNASLTLNMDGHILNNIVLNGGTVNLSKNSEFSYDKAFVGTGSVNLSNNNLAFGAKDLSWTGSIYWSGSEGNLVLNSKVSLSGTWTFSGNCSIRGNANILDLGTQGNIYVERGSTLRFKNIVIQGLSGNSLQCLDDAGTIIFDNSYLVMDDDYSFDKGGIVIEGLVDLTGSSTFFYDSLCSFSINHNSRFACVDGCTVAFGVNEPLSRDRIICYEDGTSTFILDNANFHIGSSGILFTVGNFQFSGYVSVDTDSTTTANGLIIGDGIAEHDATVRFNAGSYINFGRGHMIYALVDPDRFLSISQTAKISRAPGNVFYAEKSLVFSNATLKPDSASTLLVASDADIRFDDCKVVLPTVKFSITGSRYNSYTNLLNGNDELFLEDGTYPLYMMIKNKNNYIRGSGDMCGMTTLYNSDAELNFSFAGQILNHIILNGGRISLSKDLEIGINSYIQGPGIVDLNGYDLSFSSKDFVSTSSIYWDGYGGKINLNSKVALTGTWTFSGNCTIVGNNNPLVLKPSARIYVERGSTLNFKNVIIYGLEGTNISCIDDSSKIVFNGVLCKLTNDYYFKKGWFDVVYMMDLKSSDCTFHYQSTKPSTITNCAIFTVHTTTGFDYCPESSARNLINLQGPDSIIWLQEASLHSTSTGMQLTKGRIFVEGKCNISSDAICRAEAIEFGDGVDEANDLVVKVFAGGNFNLTSGYVVSKNIVN